MVFNRSEAKSQKNRQLSSCTCTRISNKTRFISLFIVVENALISAQCLNLDPSKVLRWAASWIVLFNPIKLLFLFSRDILQPYQSPLSMYNQLISEVEYHKHLDICLLDDCTWHKHFKILKLKHGIE